MIRKSPALLETLPRSSNEDRLSNWETTRRVGLTMLVLLLACGCRESQTRSATESQQPGNSRATSPLEQQLAQAIQDEDALSGQVARARQADAGEELNENKPADGTGHQGESRRRGKGRGRKGGSRPTSPQDAILAAIRQAGGSYDQEEGVVGVVKLVAEGVDDELLERIAALPDMDVLEVGGPRLTDQSLEAIARLPVVRALRLEGNQFSFDGLRYLTQNPNLDWLELVGLQVTDAGLGSLSALPDLKVLEISDSKLTEQHVEALKQLEAIQEINLRRTQLPATLLARLRDALPDCHVQLEE